MNDARSNPAKKRDRFKRIFQIGCVVTTVAISLISAAGYDDYILFIAGAVLCWIMTASACFAVSRELRRHPPVVGTTVFGLVCVATIVSVVIVQWPLRISYALSKRNLDVMAERVRKGETLPMPQRAGLLVIESAELSRDGIVCLWTRLRDSGNTGFVQCGPRNIPFNLWSSVELGPDWQFISED